MSKALLYDATLCIGCRLCEQGCAERNKLPYNETIALEEKLSSHKITAVLTRGDKFMRRICMNCLDPTCKSVCPVGAITKSSEGPVMYDEKKCIGCRYCMLACPFQVPTYEWDKRLPIIKKCDMCSDRVLAGRPTACAEICPTGATKFGDRDALIAEAEQRLREKPGQYVNNVFGVSEVGGTAVLLISSIPLDTFGYRNDLIHEPMPLLTWRVMKHVPDIATLGTVLLGGIWWITHRREEVAATELTDKGKPQ